MVPFLVHKIFTVYINGVLTVNVQLRDQRVNATKFEIKTLGYVMVVGGNSDGSLH